MKKALISPIEIVVLPNGKQGQRVAQVSDEAFDIAQPLFWLICDDEVIADQWYYDPADNQIKQIPEPLEIIQTEPQPETTGGTTP